MSTELLTPPVAFRFESWLQFQERTIAEIVTEYGCGRDEAAACCTDNSSHADQWWKNSLAALSAGAIPPQWWITQVQGRGAYTRWEQFLKHHPDVFDRLVAAGRSVYHPKRDGWYLRRLGCQQLRGRLRA
jgi:hypothetical protein